MRVATVVMLAAGLLGCANPYKEFYQSNVPDAADVRTHKNYDNSIIGIEIHSSNDMVRDVEELQRRGLQVIGSASFNANATDISKESVLAQAKEVGAHVVLVSSKYSHTISGAMPLSLPNSSTSTTTGSATVVGPYGSATGHGTATTTTYGSQVVMMPYSVARYDASAVFFARMKMRIGLHVERLSDEMRKSQGSNQGVRVRLVVEGAPAFVAGILVGDIIVSINSKPLYTVEDFTGAASSLPDSPVVIDILRDGKKLQKKITPAKL